MPVIHIEEFEQYKSQGYKGTFVGGCVERGEGSSFRRKAHAHTGGGNPLMQKSYKGWICVRSMKRVFMKDGRPSQLMWHEMAHILTLSGHTDKWRRKMKELGQPLQQRYEKKKRV